MFKKFTLDIDKEIWYTYSNGKLIKEVGDNTIEYVYGSEGVIGIKVNNTPYLFRKNVFGDVTHIYNAQGEVVGKYRYTAFGECTIEVGENGIASINPIRYRGYYYDDETGLYYLKSRYYDPALGRFMTIDDISYLDPETINGLKLYAYCLNNPNSYVDPDGNSILLGVLALIGVVVSGVINGCVNVISKSDGESTLGAFVGGFFEGAVSAASLAIGLAIGTMTGGAGWALLGGTIAVAGGFVGGKYGNAISQKISYGEVDWGIANLNGGLAALTNLVAYAGLFMNRDILSISSRLGVRALQNVAPSTVGLGLSMHLALIPKQNINE